MFKEKNFVTVGLIASNYFATNTVNPAAQATFLQVMRAFNEYQWQVEEIPVTLYNLMARCGVANRRRKQVAEELLNNGLIRVLDVSKPCLRLGPMFDQLSLPAGNKSNVMQLHLTETASATSEEVALMPPQWAIDKATTIATARGHFNDELYIMKVAKRLAKIK